MFIAVALVWVGLAFVDLFLEHFISISRFFIHCFVCLRLALLFVLLNSLKCCFCCCCCFCVLLSPCISSSMQLQWICEPEHIWVSKCVRVYLCMYAIIFLIFIFLPLHSSWLAHTFLLLFTSPSSLPLIFFVYPLLLVCDSFVNFCLCKGWHTIVENIFDMISSGECTLNS